jgi:hypothetical protein
LTSAIRFRFRRCFRERRRKSLHGFKQNCHPLLQPIALRVHAVTLDGPLQIMPRARVPVADLRPTQLKLGLSEVTRCAAKIAKLSPQEREALASLVVV